jgi:hypothetical protein
MDHVIDLDQAAAEIAARLSAWIASGLHSSPITWRDEAARWPQRLETDRALVADPDAIGVRVLGAGEWAELHLVLYRGGWADLNALTEDGVITECSVPVFESRVTRGDSAGQAHVIDRSS